VVLPERAPKPSSIDAPDETFQKSIPESFELQKQEEDAFKEEVLIKTETVEVLEKTESIESPKEVEVEEQAWTCPECGMVVEGSFKVCPFCEQGNRSETPGLEIVIRPENQTWARLLQDGWKRWIMVAGVVLVLGAFGIMGGGIFGEPTKPGKTTPVISAILSVTETEEVQLVIDETEAPASSPTPLVTNTMTSTSSPTITATEESRVITKDNVSRIVRLSTLEMDAHTKSLSNDVSLVAMVTCISGVPIFCHDEISVLQLPDGQRLKSLGELNTGVQSIDFSPDGSLLAIGSTNGELRIWDYQSEEVPNVVQGHQANVSAVAWSPDGSLLATGGFDEMVKIWDTSTWEVLYSIEVQYRDWYFNEVESLAWSPKGDLLAIGSHTGVVHIWSRSQGVIIQNLVTNAVGFGADEVCWSPDGEFIAGNGYYVHYDYAGHAPEMGSAKVWETDTWSEVNLPMETYGSISWSPEGSLIITKDLLDGFVIRDAEGWGEMKRIEELTDYVWSMDGSTLALLILYETLELWGLPEA
jgi:WD40 repeat protein/RNA polymerase subunit RPABC4/transcription elongation factor Spt4